MPVSFWRNPSNYEYGNLTNNTSKKFPGEFLEKVIQEEKEMTGGTWWPVDKNLIQFLNFNLLR